MAIVADRVIVELEAKLDRYNADLKRAEQNFAKSVNSQQRDIRQLEAQIARSSGGISNSLRGLAATFAAAFSARALAGFADSFTRLQNNLRVAGLEGENLTRVQNDLLALSQRYGTSVEGLSKLYGSATDASKSFGASQEDIGSLTEAVAQALKITGTDATQASGALLGLSQALASGTVRAEEFNQINEGGLRPLLQAAAASEKYGGNVSKLRNDIVEGRIASEDLFNAILQGAGELEGRAAKATLTLAGGFEALNSSLVVYFGEADKTVGISAAMGEALKAVADNLDVLIPAVAILATALGGRLVAGALGGVAGLKALGARAVAAAGSMTIATAASRGLGAALAVFGGPVGLAVTALALGIGYLATRTDEAAQASEDYAKQLDFARQASERTTDAVDALATATGRAREAALANAKALREETIQLLANAKAAVQAAIAKRQQVITEGNARIRASTRNTTGAGSGYDPTMGQIRRENRAREQAQADVWAAVEAVGEYQKQVYALDQQINAAPTVRDTPAASSGGAKTRGRGPSAADLARERERALEAAYDREISAAREAADLEAERVRALADEATDPERRAELERQLLAMERDRRLAEIDERARQAALAIADSEGLRAAEKQQELELLEKERLARIRQIEGLYGPAPRDGEIVVQAREPVYQRAITKRLADEQIERAREMARMEIDALDAQRGLAESLDERRALDFAALAISQEIERALLEQAIAQGQIADAARARALLEQRQAAEREETKRRNESPLERYIDEINKTEEEINEEFERIQVRGLESLNDGLVDAIMGAKSLGEVFHDVANQIIADLLRIAIQQLVIKPLLEALGGGDGGGGGLGGFFAGLFGGRASGGHTVGGRMYRVTDGEGFMAPGSGKIIPLGRMRQAGGGGVTLQQTVNVDARGVNPDGYADHIKAAVRQETIAIVREGMGQVSKQVPARMAEYQRDGR